MNDDMYSLVAWLEEESLKAHNAIPDEQFVLAKRLLKEREITLNEVISHIRNGSKKELHRTLTERNNV